MEPSQRENVAERLLALEREKKVCTKNIELFSFGILAGGLMIGISIVALVYYVIDSWRVETLPKYNSSLFGVLLPLIGGGLSSRMSKQKKEAQLALADVEHQIERLKQPVIQ